MKEYDALVKKLKRPNWRDEDRVHNWRNYVDNRIKKVWSCLDDDVRIHIYIQARTKAEAEVWD